MERKIAANWPEWTVMQRIGSGSFGSVYEIARNNRGNIEKAAVKVITIPKDRGEIESLYNNGHDDASITKRLQGHLDSIVREYSLMQEMKGYTNIVCCDDIKYSAHENDIGWDIFIKMERLTPLTQTMKQYEQLGMDRVEEQAILLGIDICNALALCKKRNIIHRDIKPENILVSKYGDFKLADFGVARTAEQTISGTIAGSFGYMSPEVYKHEPYNASVDIYSLGLLMHWMLNKKRPPFVPLPPADFTAAEEITARERRFLGESIPAPAYGCSALKKIILKACAFSPNDRYASAEDMLKDLTSLAGNMQLLRIEPSEAGTVYLGADPAPPSPISAPLSSPASSSESVPSSVPQIFSVAEPAPSPVSQPSPKNGTISRKKLIPIVAAALAAVFCLTIGVLLIPRTDTHDDTISKQPASSDISSDTVADNNTDNLTNEGTLPDTDSSPKEAVWSNWTSSLPNYVFDGSYTIEKKTQYRSAPLHYFVGSGQLTDEYTICYTRYNEWGAWSDWTTNSTQASELIQVESKIRYKYHDLYSYQYRTGIVTRTGYAYGNWNYSDTPVEKRSGREIFEEPLYRFRTRDKIYYCAMTSEWSEYGDSVILPTQVTAVSMRTVYRYSKSTSEPSAPSMENFPDHISDYTSRFVDVDDSNWYGANQNNWVGIAVEIGAMSPNEYMCFRPNENMTIGEIIKAAVTLRQIYNGENIVLQTSSPWYDSYVDYAIEAGIIEAGIFVDYTKVATRAEAAYILCHAIPSNEIASLNKVSAITDMDSSSVYFNRVWKLAEAGIIGWENPEGAFNPNNLITRAEIAAMIGRIAYPELRIIN